MAEDGPPLADEEGWLEADQPGRPFIAQISERRTWLLSALALVVIVVSVIVVAGPRLVATTRPAPLPKPQASSSCCLLYTSPSPRD